MKQRENEVWHRPGFEDRRGELITKTAAAQRAKVTASTISTWATRYPDFPATVLSFTDGPVRYLHAGEFDTWHAKFMASRHLRGNERMVADRVRAEWELPLTRADQKKKLAKLRARRQAALDRITKYDAQINTLLNALDSGDE